MSPHCEQDWRLPVARCELHESSRTGEDGDGMHLLFLEDVAAPDSANALVYKRRAQGFVALTTHVHQNNQR